MNHGSNIVTPTLLLNSRRTKHNIKNMTRKVANNRVTFRPHFKTHQSAEIGEWFRDAGVDKITVSSVKMADYFARHGWKDITVAFPVNIREIEQINQLSNKIKLNLLVESLEAVRFLGENLRNKTDVWIKIDVGAQRTGVAWDNHKDIKALAQEIGQFGNLQLAGLLTHAGHTYSTSSVDEIKHIYFETASRMQAGADLLTRFGHRDVKISVWDTPGCSVIDDFSDVDEIRPGNFVFYDVMQLRLGVCSEEQIAVALACPVVAKHADRLEIVVHGGAVHLSKEFITDKVGRKMFGYATELIEDGWGTINEENYVSKLSQEHGIIRAEKDFFDRINIGDLIAILPVHSCLTVNLMKEYLTLDGEKTGTMQDN